MCRRLNLLDRAVYLTVPAREAPSTWTQRVPFAMWQIVAQSLRLTRATARQGVMGLVRRKAAQAASQLAERSALGRSLHLPWQPDGRPVFLLVSHHYGGGTERHVCDLEGLLRSEGVRPILVRPGPNGSLVWEERVSRGEIAWCRRSGPDRESLERFLDLLDPVHAHVHHLAGLPDALIDLLAQRGVRYDWTIHDYQAICPRIQLIGAQGVYCGEPPPAACNTCVSRLGDASGRRVSESITVWRERFRQHLRGARRVFAPSEDAARRIARYVAGLKPAIRPHFEESRSPGPLAKGLLPGEPVRAVVLGTIVPAKGSERLLACARDARARRLPLEFHVLGSTDRNAQLARLKNVHVAGPYRESEVFERLAAARCHIAFLPSVWPETFLYTFSIVMAAGFYTLCYDLGAQAERLRAWGWGQALPLEMAPHAVNDALLDAARRLATEPGCPPPPAPAMYPDPFWSYYGFSAQELAEMRLPPSRRPTGAGTTPRRLERKVHEHPH
jgi:glycosyltransferase involved in cell wall biosynthesis